MDSIRDHELVPPKMRAKMLYVQAMLHLGGNSLESLDRTDRVNFEALLSLAVIFKTKLVVCTLCSSMDL